MEAFSQVQKRPAVLHEAWSIEAEEREVRRPASKGVARVESSFSRANTYILGDFPRIIMGLVAAFLVNPMMVMPYITSKGLT